MPLHKTRPTGRRSCGSSTQSASGQAFPSHLLPHSPTSTDKSSQAAQMAQELASQSSWADTYAPTTPATTATPPESVADSQSHLDTSDPPPSYEAARLERDLPPIPRARQENCIKGIGTGFWLADGTLLPPLPNREYKQHETSETISGTFTFYDSLELSTTSGSINVVIDPQASDKVGVIKITSSSGSIKVKFSDEYVAKIEKMGTIDRTYDITIRSSTGSQSHELLQINGGSVSLTASHGSINAKLYMVGHIKDRNATKLTTETTHGSQNIKVKAMSSEPLTTLAGQLNSKNSGTIKLNLPSVWQGMVHGLSAGSGSVNVKGDNLQFQRNGSKEVYAWRMHSNPETRKEGQVIEMRGDGSGSLKVDCSAS